MADALKTKILTEMVGGKVYGAILNRAGMENTELRRHSVEDVLGVRVIDMIPEDANVRRASCLQDTGGHQVPDIRGFPGLPKDCSRPRGLGVQGRTGQGPGRVRGPAGTDALRRHHPLTGEKHPPKEIKQSFFLYLSFNSRLFKT